MEIYVDEDGRAYDDEGNTWFVGKDVPEGLCMRRDRRWLTSRAPDAKPNWRTRSRTVTKRSK